MVKKSSNLPAQAGFKVESRKGSRSRSGGKRIVLALGLLLSTFNFQLSTALCQQAQAQQGQPIYAVNAKYVQGMGPGYWPTAGTGLTLNVAAGTAICGNPPVKVDYAGGTLTMTNAATNYVYLDPTASCSPAKNTTGFTAGMIPLAQVVAAGGAITGVTDVRNWFVDPNSLGPVIRADLMPGADAGAKIQAAHDALPSTGGTALMGFEGQQDFTTPIVITKPVILEGLGRHATVLHFTPTTGTAITVTVPSGTNRSHVVLEDFSLIGAGKSTGTTTGILVTDGVGFRAANLYLEAFSVDGLAITGDSALGTNTNMSSADGMYVRDVGGNAIRLYGNNCNVFHFVNLDLRSSGVGLYLQASGEYPADNFFQGHISYNTINVKIESRFNVVEGYFETSGLTTWHLDMTSTSGYNNVLAFNSWDTTKIRDLGTRNIIRRSFNSTKTYSTDTPATVIAGEFGNSVKAISGANSSQIVGVTGSAGVAAANTQNWTSSYGFNPFYSVFSTDAGATGTISNVALFRGYVYHNATGATVSNLYGVYIPANSGAGTVSTKYSFYGASGSGPGYFADGLKIGGGTTIVKHLSATASLDFTALAANSCEVLTITVTGAADGNVVTLGVPNALADADGATERTTFFGWVSAADTVSVRRCNVTGSATGDPAAATVRADVWQH
jgi:hypothetical protein